MSRDEMREVLTAVKRDTLGDQSAVVREEILDEVMKYADVSGDGQIERQHLLAAIKKYKSRMMETAHMDAFFAKHDVSNSGDLNKTELLALLRELHHLRLRRAEPQHIPRPQGAVDGALVVDRAHAGGRSRAAAPAAGISGE